MFKLNVKVKLQKTTEMQLIIHLFRNIIGIMIVAQVYLRYFHIYFFVLANYKTFQTWTDSYSAVKHI